MSIYEMNITQLTGYKFYVENVCAKYYAAGEEILGSMVKNQLRHINTQIEYLSNKHIWDLI